MKVPNIDYQKEIKKCKTMDDVVGKNGLMQKLLKDVMQQLLEAEMDEHLGRKKYERTDEDEDANYRNGYSNKSVRSSYGEVPLDVPRDRNAQFEPRAIKKYEKDCNELDKKIIGLYARGMSTRDIQSELEELYGIDVSPSMISKITDKVMNAAAEWQNRMLDPVYPIVYMDAVHFKVRDEHRIVTKAAYVCMGIDMKGYKDILGIWIGEAEGAKFWLGVCNDLSNRGVKDILIACMDGLRGLPDAIKAVFPRVCIQNCIIHQIRNSIKYIASKNKKEFIRDLKLVYKADTEEIALAQLDELKNKWGKTYESVIDSWYENWDKLSTYFSYTKEIRKIIYTTNALEGFNRQLRKFTKTRTVFPTDDSLRKSLYLATEQVMKKWISPMPNWGMTLLKLEIMFKERINEALAI
ncbi:IS256 family transposase [Clostridium felsineum]|uniref:Mutator family transposase n=1 Tax=Clostridium felsineum TaxID=36839 RepID=A0A1S8LQG8_9CLOT|nr:IS256 family transposase [Clostridium felsineum]URZ01088.1 IS256 family transposase ISCpe3 [Clostridium felsineum]URZ02409.1 IS256 family transposase ISCpe3 [Clostridium felsineum]URZ02540.1 IS256 family transposase ISCpe3 [Clostridium felsineum]URZ02955.1 IS256 family transposase ISCpe3 [Clostridium felsineum]URZ03116.1 IS256 family transposase ISCpe3 [Clostridium felsineum]